MSKIPERKEADQAKAESVERKLEKLKILEAKSKLREGLPFLYGWKWYAWAREFYESTNKVTLLVAGNQLSKSSTQIRRFINLATNREIWPIMWRKPPKTLIYLYPTKDVALTEFEQKWVPEFMPRGEYKTHPTYGWTFDKKRMVIHFNSGVSLFFKSYSQNESDLQTITADAVGCDEELPVEIYDELMFRLAATNGYFSMVFTATIGQDFWRRAMECIGSQDEVLNHAKKIHASAYDCLEYDDGSRSHWTEDRITELKNQCKSHNEILKRIYGRFVVDDGLKYPSYDSIKCRTRDGSKPPEDWQIFSAVDVGGGGAYAHPSAIVFIAVSPDFARARVFKAWRGDGIVTTAADAYLKYVDLRGRMRVIRQFYDWASGDFGVITSRVPDAFERAEKSHEIGEQFLNSLFKNGALTVDEGDFELDKLDIELSTLRLNIDKRKAKDDLADALRYAVTKIPWNWTAITGVSIEEAQRNTAVGGIDELLRQGSITREECPRFEDEDSLQAEFDEWNGMYH